MKTDRKSALTVARLRKVLDYEPETGVFVWKVTRSFRAVAGAVAGSEYKATGYLRVQIDGTSYLAHQLAWLHYYGEWPSLDIDHINGEKADNRIANLREATPSQNGQNLRNAMGHNKSGLLGAHFDSASKRWRAVIYKNGRRYDLGSFDDNESAHAAYMEAKKAIHEYGEIAADLIGKDPSNKLKKRHRVAPKSSRSGIIGASYRADCNKWQSRIKVNGKYIHLGLFKTAEEAGAAYQAALSKLANQCE